MRITIILMNTVKSDSMLDGLDGCHSKQKCVFQLLLGNRKHRTQSCI